MKLNIFLLILSLLVSCGANTVKLNTGNSSSQLGKISCGTEIFDPKNTQELFAMIDKLPKPIELECILKTLKRPLAVHATSSTMSVQPAVSARDPRIFIFSGNLILSFVTAGEGSLVFEFSELKSDVRSIKGEFEIPIVSNFQNKEAFSRINRVGKTTCSGCHFGEYEEYLYQGVQVYSSKALKPTSSSRVPLATLMSEYSLCQIQKSASRRCAIYAALLSQGNVTEREFPEDTPTLQNSF